MSTEPGPNDIEPCPSESCRRWHLARGRLHVCGRDKPAPERVERAVEDLHNRLVRDWFGGVA
jgi:hypothetical protein